MFFVFHGRVWFVVDTLVYLHHISKQQNDLFNFESTRRKETATYWTPFIAFDALCPADKISNAFKTMGEHFNTRDVEIVSVYLQNVKVSFYIAVLRESNSNLYRFESFN